ncbi:hypothetical protein FDZ73_20440 [bacterium]|nr:MAG: hypothetical protein FDZ73_20440 [bacterium]
MSKVNWQDPASNEIRSPHISGLQEAVGKIEDAIQMKTKALTGVALSEVYISGSDRYRIYQAPAGSRNWASSPAPVIKKNAAVISTGFEIDYGGGAIIFTPPILGTDVITADVTVLDNTADRTARDPFILKSAVYDGPGNKIVCTIAPGSGRFNAGLVTKAADSTYDITAPAINTTYYVYLKSDGTFTHNTTGIFVAGQILLHQISTGAVVSTITTIDVRGEIAEVPGYTPADKTITDAHAAATDPHPQYSNNSLFRQAIINGNFDVWQRGASFTHSSIVKYCADRWIAYRESWAGGLTTSRQDGTGVAGSQYCIRVQRDNANADVSGINLHNVLETVDSVKFRGKKVNVSFYARKAPGYSAAGSLLYASIESSTGVDQQRPTAWVGALTEGMINATLTTNWQKFTFTTTNTVSTLLNQLGLRFTITPVGTAGVDDYVEITQVQFCAGDVDLPFQPKSFEEELRACLRYYEKSYAYNTVPGTATNEGLHITIQGAGTIANSTRIPLGVPPVFKIEKRALPTVKFWSVTGVANQWMVESLERAISGSPYLKSVWILNNTGGSIILTSGAEAYGHWTVDAEL